MPTCQQCKFFDGTYLRCLRFPPRVYLIPPESGNYFKTEWPQVYSYDRCGEFLPIPPAT